MNQQLVQTIGIVLGVLLALPLLTALVYIAMFAATLKAGATALTQRLEDFIKRVDANFESHDVRLMAAEAQLSVLWDGHERRAGTDRRAED